MTAAFGTVGAIGGNALSEVLIDRIRQTRPNDSVVEEESLRSGLTDAFAEILNSASPDLAAARDGVAVLLRDSGAFEELIREALREDHQELLVALQREFEELGRAHEELRPVLVGMQDLLLELCRNQAQILEVELSVRETVQESLRVLVQMFQHVQLLGTGPAADPERAQWNGSPYLGLQPYTANDAPVFFGRASTLAELVGKAGESISGGLMVVTGSSGVGKSSLLRAGLIPAIERGLLRSDAAEGPWRAILLDRPGAAPVSSLAAELAKHGGPDSTATRKALVADPDEAADRVEERRTGRDGARPERMLLVIDQFEEVFTLVEDQERSRFLRMIDSIARSPRAFVVLAVRGDFVDRCMTVPALREAVQDRVYRVGPMSRDQFRQAALLPAAAAGVHIEDMVVRSLVEELCGPDRSDEAPLRPEAALPLLSQTMLLLWERRGDRRTLTLDSYHALNGVSNAVATAAEQVFGSLDAAGQATAIGLFRRLIGVKRPDQLVRLEVDLHKLTGSERAIADEFTAKRLMVMDRGTVAIAHDVLLEQWTRLREWIEPDIESRILLTRLEADTATWQEHGGDESFLYQGSRLDHLESRGIKTWQAYPERELRPSPKAEDFIDKSRARARRRIRIRRLLTGSLAGITALALILAALAYVQSQDLIEQRNRVLSEQLAAESAALVGTNGQLAQLLAAAAWELRETDEASAALTGAIGDATAGEIVTDPIDGIENMAPNPDGSHLATTGESGLVRVWSTEDWTSQELPAEVRPRATATALTFDATGEVLAVVTEQGVTLWDIATSQAIMSLDFLDAHVVAFSPDGSKLAVMQQGTSYTDDGDTITTVTESEVSIWDLSSGEEIARRGGIEAQPTIAFSADGASVALVDISGELWEWTFASDAMVSEQLFGESEVTTLWVGDGEQPQLFACGPGRCFARNGGKDWESVSTFANGQFVSITPDGRAIVSTDGGPVVVVDLVNGDMTTLATQGEFNYYYTTLIPNSSTLVVGTARGMQLLDFERVPPPEAPEMSWEYGSDLVDVAEDSSRFMIHGSAGIEVWETDDWSSGPAELVTAIPSIDFTGGAMSPDGGVVAIHETVEEGIERLRLIDASTGSDLPTPTEEYRFVAQTQFGPSGNELAMIVGIGPIGEVATYELWIWDMVAGELVLQLDATAGMESHFVFVPEKERIALAGADGIIAIWDYRDGELADSITSGASKPEGLAFNIDGSRLGVATPTGLIVWDMETKESESYETGRIFGGLAFTPDDRFVVTIDGADSLRFWDLERRQVAADMRAGDTVNSAEFLSSGWQIAVGNGSQLMVLDASTLIDPFATVCEQAGRSLTPEEWAEYLPDFEYGEISVCT
ncbi:WD40 repeat [Glycomyces sambucus]|uniref:WD40 repeat n=1 Tax=Glycomyces sambucus TaxID=380244 RepID=A0A1G9J6W8_9ACTN|nr:WD40 repeat [Glycomyces sambucus]